MRIKPKENKIVSKQKASTKNEFRTNIKTAMNKLPPLDLIELAKNENHKQQLKFNQTFV